ncbi:MAG TPA: hypothetical protein VF698_19090 [Thermoanaerobaculia bacterium]|jgi:hypothetical protein
MKTLAITLLLALAQETPAPEQQPVTVAKPKDTAALVEAARAAKASRRKSTSKVITNSDVKRSKGKLHENVPLPIAEEALAKGPTELELHEKNRKLRLAAEDAVAAAEKKVAELEKEVSRLEMSFYEENDPNYRDSVIHERFTQAKRRLDDARQELAEARDTLAGVIPKAPGPEVIFRPE